MTEFPSEKWADYELIDSGRGEKLERFGRYVLRRPEPKALWDPSMSEVEWSRIAHTSFTPGAGFGKAGKEDAGTWNRLKKMDDQWYIRYAGGPEFTLRLGMTSFKHVGVFPEQAPNWEYIFRETQRLRRAGIAAPKVLNLFAYTGGASLAARAAGAEVTHLDSVRQVVNWAHGNMERSGMDGIHWVVEDAMKFAKREARRGNLYDGIILDPPAYGHGPDGEKWKLDECLFEMIRTVGRILEPENSFLVLNLYSNGFSAALGETVLRQGLDLGCGATALAGAQAGRGAAAQGGAQAGRGAMANGTTVGGANGIGDGAAANGIGGSAAASGEPAPAQTFRLESGELALRDRFGKVLPLSIVERLSR